MKNDTENENRTTLFGAVVEEMNNGRTKVSYTDAATGDMIERVLLNDMIDATMTLDDGTTAWLLKNVTVGGVEIDVRATYKCAIDGAEQQDLSDNWAESRQLYDNIAVLADEDEPPMDDNADSHDEPAMDDDEPAMDDDEPAMDAFDDSVPVVTDTNIELSGLLVDALTDDEGKAGKQKQSASAKAAKAREALYASAVKVQENMSMKTDMAKALVSGKRWKDFSAWNFKVKAYSVDARMDDSEAINEAVASFSNDIEGIIDKYDLDEVESKTLLSDLLGEMKSNGVNLGVKHIPIQDGEGNDRVRVLYNPTLANKGGHGPLGAVLNRAAGPNFEWADHGDIFIPCIEAVDDLDGVSWDAYAFNQGARAGLTIDLSAMATTARKEAADGLEGYLNLDANLQTAFLEEENGGHRCGVTIINSHDGKAALSGYLTVMRTYCKNLAMRGANQQMFKVRHMAGALAAFDISEVASGLRAAFIEGQQHLLSMAVLRYLPIEMNTFDKLLTAFDRQGLITPPRVTVDINDLDKMVDKVTGEDISHTLTPAQKDSIRKLGGGHSWNAVTKGWMNPDLDYVKCEDDSIGTIFHAAQCVTGHLTHKPIYADGKRVLHGNTEGVETFMKKSVKATNFFENIAEESVKTYLQHTGKETLGAEDMADFKQYFADNPSAIKVGFKSSKGAKNSKMTSVDEIPNYESTWKVNLIKTA